MSSTVQIEYPSGSTLGFLYGHAGAAQIGKARDFINRIGKHDQAVFEVCKRSYALAKKGFTGRTPKPAYLISVQRSWEDMPLQGTVISNVTRDKTGLYIKEVRLSASKLRVETWEEDSFEVGLSMSFFILTVTKEVCRFHTHELYFIGLHALSRLYQKGGYTIGDLDDTAVMAAIGKLFTTYSSAFEGSGATFAVSASGGYWRGERCQSYRADKPGTILRVKTWMED